MVNFETVQDRGILSARQMLRVERFLSRVSILTRDIDIANLSVRPSVCLSVRYVPVPDENGLTHSHSLSPYGSQIILVLPASNIFTKFRRGHPLRGTKYRWSRKNSRFSTISRYISQTIQNIAIVTTEGE